MEHATQVIQSSQAANQFWMWLIGIIVILMQAIQVIQNHRAAEKFSAICDEIKGLWKRTNKHGHSIGTDAAGKPITTGVIISDKE